MQTECPSQGKSVIKETVLNSKHMSDCQHSCQNTEILDGEMAYYCPR